MFDQYGGGHISWREVGSVFQALGHPFAITSEMLQESRLKVTQKDAEGLTQPQLYALLESSSLRQLLNYGYNSHNDDYNIKVIKKAVSLLSQNHLNLSELHNARLSFYIYEGSKPVGIEMNQLSLTKCLKLADRHTTNKKMVSWCRNASLDVPNRVQLYEFLDVYAEATQRSRNWKGANDFKIQMGNRGLYELMEVHKPNQVATVPIDLEKIRETAISKSKRKEDRAPSSNIFGIKPEEPRYNYNQLPDRISSTLECYDHVAQHLQTEKTKTHRGSRQIPLDSVDVVRRVEYYQKLKAGRKSPSRPQKSRTGTQRDSPVGSGRDLASKTPDEMRMTPDGRISRETFTPTDREPANNFSNPDDTPQQNEGEEEIDIIPELDIPLPPYYSKSARGPPRRNHELDCVTLLKVIQDQQQTTEKTGIRSDYNFRGMLEQKAIVMREKKYQDYHNHDEFEVTFAKPSLKFQKEQTFQTAIRLSRPPRAPEQDEKVKGFIDSVRNYRLSIDSTGQENDPYNHRGSLTERVEPKYRRDDELSTIMNYYKVTSPV
eukprot:TRINITY_DN7115_c0_g1_i1.p1 TRINITY_DN7115_c0_g1~~TRINITY_DN7115_c0_g1_i1.p1  ORF type:complete len:546 (+),score=104.39 TRINITY_DN7115_c0_g1_i1:77-1714(+)